MKNTRFVFLSLMLLMPAVAQAGSIEMAIKAMDGFEGSTSFVYNPSEAFDEIYCSISETGSADGNFSAWLSESHPAAGASVGVSAELTNYVYDSHAGAQDLLLFHSGLREIRIPEDRVPSRGDGHVDVGKRGAHELNGDRFILRNSGSGESSYHRMMWRKFHS